MSDVLSINHTNILQAAFHSTQGRNMLVRPLHCNVEV